MHVTLRHVCCVLSILFAPTAVSPAADTPETPSTEKPAAEHADPKTTYRTYIEAVWSNNVEAAKACWTIDDDNKSGALDTILGIWISERHFKQVAAKKFGAERIDIIFKGRNDLSDAALELTKKRLDGAEIRIVGDDATLKIMWKDDDGYPNPAFEFSGGPTNFRNVKGNWKIDANKMTGLKRGSDFFAKESWGPMIRCQVVVLNEAIDAMENGKVKSVTELEDFIKEKFETSQKRYEEEIEKESLKGK